jgi:hypothetical protein
MIRLQLMFLRRRHGLTELQAQLISAPFGEGRQ